MSIIHQTIYQKGNLAGIEMKDYFHTLGASIPETINARQHVQPRLDMQSADLDVDTAFPVDLIANELLTNVLKHAFPDNTTNIVWLIST